MIIDGHVHIFPDSIVETAVNTLQNTSVLAAPYKGSLSSLRHVMDRYKIDKVVNLPVATRPEQVKQINNHLLHMPSDTISFAAFHPDVEKPESTLQEIKNAGYRGVKIHPEYQGFSWDTERMHRICDVADRLDIILFTHSGWDVSFEDMHSTIAEFASVAGNFPRLKFVAAHFGGYMRWDDVEKYLLCRDNVYFDTSFTFPYLAPERMKKMTYKHGLEKVFFGTDFPWQSYEKEFYYLSSLFSSSELERIYSENILNFLGIDSQ